MDMNGKIIENKVYKKQEKYIGKEKDMNQRKNEIIFIILISFFIITIMKLLIIMIVMMLVLTKDYSYIETSKYK